MTANSHSCWYTHNLSQWRFGYNTIQLSRNVIANNTIDGNSLGVIITRSPYDNSIQHNMIKGSHSNGIYLYENSTNNTFKNNTIRESIGYDINVQEKSTSNNTFIKNNITKG